MLKELFALQESGDTFAKSVYPKCANLAFPDDQGLPPHGPQSPPILSVAIDVPRELWDPVVLVARWNAMAPFARMLMPEAPMDKDHFAAAGKDNIRYAREISTMQPKTIPQRMYDPSNRYLRLSVLGVDPPHQPASFFGAEGIRHASCPVVVLGNSSW